ncbi:hypothetical protein DL767_011050 [Monosporascus sp. MG133]|nr:hypothetical protein DL767_011050 [Monosporascus sp. MG133]
MLQYTSSLIQGFDTIQEEFYHFTVDGVLPRGHAALNFDRPGQGMVARPEKHRLHLRGDFEVTLKDGESQAMWSPVGVGQGSLQAKVAAFSPPHSMTFGWLDSVFNIERPSLQQVKR